MKKISILMAALTFPVLLTGCKNKNGDGVSIEFMGWGSDAEYANYQKLVDEFMVENPDIKVVYRRYSTDSYLETLDGRSNSLPDVFYVPDYEFFSWADGGDLLELDEYVTQEELSSIWAQSTQMFRYDMDTCKLGTGSLYGLPKDLGPYSLVFNKDMLRDAIAKAALDGKTISEPSYTVPMTYSEFRNYLLDLKPYLVTQKNPKGYGIGSYELMHCIWSNNADFFDESAKTSKIKEKNFTDALQWAANLSLVDHVMPTADEQGTNAFQRFLNSGCLFTFMGPWDMTDYWKEVNFEFDLIPTPVGDASGSKSTSWCGSVAYVVRNTFKKSESAKKDAAVKFAKWLTFSEKSNKLNYTIGQAIPNNIEMAKNDFLNNVDLVDRKVLPEHKQVWIDMIEGTSTVTSRHRAAYYLYDRSCFTDLETSLIYVWKGEETAVNWANRYNSTFQNLLDDSAANLY